MLPTKIETIIILSSSSYPTNGRPACVVPFEWIAAVSYVITLAYIVLTPQLWWLSDGSSTTIHVDVGCSLNHLNHRSSTLLTHYHLASQISCESRTVVVVVVEMVVNVAVIASLYYLIHDNFHWIEKANINVVAMTLLHHWIDLGTALQHCHNMWWHFYGFQWEWGCSRWW